MANPLPDLVPLARLGPVTYAHLDGVFAIHDDHQLCYHSSRADWPLTPEARAAAIDQELAAAEARVVDLVAQRAALQPRALLAAPATQAVVSPPRTHARVRCLGCDRDIATGWFGRHCASAHPAMNPAALRGAGSRGAPPTLTPPVGAEPPPGN